MGTLHQRQQCGREADVPGPGKTLWHQTRQNEARDRERGRETNHREYAELHEAGEARKYHDQEAGDRHQCTESEGRPDTLQTRLRAALPLTLHEQINRVVNRLTDQSHTEAERNAMYETGPQTHGGEPCQRAADDRQHGQ